MGRRGLVVAVATFLRRLTAWPRHNEDETLALRSSPSSRSTNCSTSCSRSGAARRPTSSWRVAALRRRSDRASPRLRPLRARGPAADRDPRRPARRPCGRVDHHRARLRELGAAVPRRVRPDVQPVSLHERRSYLALLWRSTWRRSISGCGVSRLSLHLEPSVRRAGAHVAGPVRRARASPRSPAVIPFAVVGVLATPFWLADLRLAVLRRRSGRQLKAVSSALRCPCSGPGRRRLHRGLVDLCRPLLALAAYSARESSGDRTAALPRWWPASSRRHAPALLLAGSVARRHRRRGT